MSARGNAFAVSVALAFGLAGCGSGDQTPHRPAPEVGVVIIRAQSVNLTVELPGRTVPYAISDVRPQVSGIIQKRLFVEGSEVKQGDTLYQIDPKPYQADYDSAVATLATAKAKDVRYAALLKENAIAPQTYDDARAAYLQAKAAADTARINLGYTKVKAPISGRIGISAVTEGALVTANQATALTTIQTLDPIYVDIAQSSSQLLQLRQAVARGQLDQNAPVVADVTLQLEDGTAYSQTGKLQFADVTVDPTTGAVTLRALFPNPQHFLLPGMYVRAVISEGIDPHAILAPQEGVARDIKGEPTALVVGKHNKVEQRTLTVSRTIGADWLVTSGLKPGDRLIVEGTQKAQPGMAVDAVPASSKGKPNRTKPGR
jgi:membrane fusion protein (multidrug efflux system)